MPTNVTLLRRRRAGGGTPVIPAITTNPTILGTAEIGFTLTALPGTTTGYPPPDNTWQWYRGGVLISGATSQTYQPTYADLGTVLTVTQTATNGSGSANATSSGTSAVLLRGKFDFSKTSQSGNIQLFTGAL